LNDDSNQYGGGGYGVTGGPQYNRPNNEYNQRPNYPDGELTLGSAWTIS
jgi:hypothetical protein